MEVEWSDLALAQLREVIEYVSERFGEQVALDTYYRVDTTVSRLGRFPEIGSSNGVVLSAKFPVRRLPISQNLLYYFIDTEYDKIVVLAFVHSRRSPQTVNAILMKSLERYKRGELSK